MEVAPNIHKVVVGKLANNLYLVTGERAVFIDTSPGTDEQVEALVELWDSVGRPQIAAIVLTHWHYDHTGGAERLAEAARAEVLCSAVERPQIESTMPGASIGRTVADGETLDLGGATLEFVYTPGHTAGSTSVYYRERKALFAGDTVIRGSAGPFHIDPDTGDMDVHLQSLRKLQGYDIELIGPGHGPEVHQPRAFLKQELATLSQEGTH